MLIKQNFRKKPIYKAVKLIAILILVFPFSIPSEQIIPGTEYNQIIHTDPPNQIHTIKVDLTTPDLSFHIVTGKLTKEGNIILTDPFELANKGNFIVAINSNPWSMVDGTTKYIKNSPARNIGWIQLDGKTISPPGSGIHFWINSKKEPFIGKVAIPIEDVIIGIEGFSQIIKDGEILPDDNQRHPRTAIGFDREKRYLIMVVVDGRMPGYSEGMTLGELASLMKELGCWNAINLDGGGSSIMLVRSIDGFQRKNTGVYGNIRPLPLLFGIIKKHLNEFSGANHE